MWFLIFLISFGILLVFIELLILPGFGCSRHTRMSTYIDRDRCRLVEIRLANRANFYRDNLGDSHSIGNHRAIAPP